MTTARCATHPDVATGLTCSRCGTPICPKCLVQTPVGARCRACARLGRLPTFQADLKHYTIGAGVGLGSAVGIGFAWLYLGGLVPFPYVPLILAVGAGYLVGQAISLSVNRKRGLVFQIIAGVCTFISYGLVTWLAPWLTFGQSLYGLVVLAIAIYLAILPFR